MKKTLFYIFIFLIFIPNVNAFELSSEKAVLYNMNENKIIYELNKNEKTSIASLTKIMTTLVAIENIKDYNEKVTINYEMLKGLVEENAAVIGLKVGQSVTYNDLLYGMFLSSGADATRAIAISISGNEKKFVELMNIKAKELGMLNTHFENTVGLDDINHYSTVNDVSIMLRAALKNSKFYEIFSSESYVFSDKSLTAYSTLKKTAKKYNYDVSYIIGAKTGFTYDAGKCLASLAIDKENNIKYLLVTTNASINTNDAYHIKDAVTIYNYYFQNYKYYNIVKKGELLLNLPTKYGKKEANFYAYNDISYYYDNSFDSNKILLKYNGLDLITTNMKEGTRVGEIEVFYDNELVDVINIYLEEKINFSIIQFLKDNIFYFVAFILIIILFNIKRIIIPLLKNS